MPQNNPMRRSRKSKPQTSGEQEIVDKGLDRNPDLNDRLSKKTRDFSVPLNEFYHRRLNEISQAMTEQVGVPVKRRPLAANALREFIDQKSKELGLDVAEDNTEE